MSEGIYENRVENDRNDLLKLLPKLGNSAEYCAGKFCFGFPNSQDITGISTKKFYRSLPNILIHFISNFWSIYRTPCIL